MRYVSLAQASDITSLSIKTLRGRFSYGTLPAKRVGTLIGVRVDDLDCLFRAIPSARVRP